MLKAICLELLRQKHSFLITYISRSFYICVCLCHAYYTWIKTVIFMMLKWQISQWARAEFDTIIRQHNRWYILKAEPTCTFQERGPFEYKWDMLTKFFQICLIWPWYRASKNTHLDRLYNKISFHASYHLKAFIISGSVKNIIKPWCPLVVASSVLAHWGVCKEFQVDF